MFLISNRWFFSPIRTGLLKKKVYLNSMTCIDLVTSLREPEPGYFRGSQDILEGARASIKKYRKLEPEPVNPIKTTPGSQEPGAGAC